MSIINYIKDLLPKNRQNDCDDLNYNKTTTDEGLIFSIDPAVFQFLMAGHGHGKLLIQHVILTMLHESGVAKKIPNGFEINSEKACLLEPDVVAALGLPEYFEGVFDVKANGVSSKDNFEIKIFLKYNNQEQPAKRKGPFLIINDYTKFLLTPPQLIALQAIEHHSQLTAGERTEFNNLDAIMQLQLAQQQGMKIKNVAHFKNLNLVEPGSITITAQQTPSGSLILSPSLSDGSTPEDLDRRWGQIDGDGRVLRVKNQIILLSEDKKRAIKEVLGNRSIPADKVAEFIKTPSAFLDASLVNLDIGFSIRVAGIGEMVYLPFGKSIDGVNSKWFATNNKSEPPERLRILLQCEDDLNAFEASYSQAKGQSADIIEVEDELIDIRDEGRVQESLHHIRKQLKKPHLDEETDIDDDNGIIPKAKVSLLLKDALFQNGNILSKADFATNVDFDHSNLKRKPYPHQSSGISWMLSLLNSALLSDSDDMYRVQGALLADDMGLGKTYMILVMLAEYLSLKKGKKEPEKPILVVAPLSLLENWESEIAETFHESPFRDVTVLRSGRELKHFKREKGERESMQLSTVMNNSNADHDSVRYALNVGPDAGAKRLDIERRIVLATYETLRDYQFSLCIIDWGVVVFDEAQYTKNPNTQATRAAKALKADLKLLATGTPVENSLSEFWCLMDTAQPGLLGDWAYFRNRWIKPINDVDEDDKDKIRLEVGKDLRDAAGKFMLRRTKEEELTGLPKKTILSGCFIDGRSNLEFYPKISRKMSGGQLIAYNEVIEDYRKKKALEDNGNYAISTLSSLRSISLHHRLDDLFEIPPLNKKEAIKRLKESKKIEMLIEVLNDIRSKQEKVIIFAINKKLQAVLKICLDMMYDLDIRIINGDTKAVATKKSELGRKGMIEDFERKSGFNIIIMSPVAAGVGLTVVGANHVVHLERHWNPGKEAQATDRVYRIGQVRDVFIYLLCALHPDYDSFDVNLDRLLSSKILLKDAVVTTNAVKERDMVSAMGL